MMRWHWAAAPVSLLVLLYVACQAGTGNGLADNDDSPTGSGTAAVYAEADEGDPPAAPGTGEQGEKPEQEKPKPDKAKEEKPAKKPGKEEATEEEEPFADFAFPPTVSDVEYHQNAWYRDDCLRCHETGVEDATVVSHKDMPEILLTAKCRSCHVLIPGMKPVKPKKSEEDALFEDYAFPPMIPASDSHKEAWHDDNCLLCHEDGVRGAPIVRHKDMPAVLLKSKCRSCHVQVRCSTLPGR